MVSSGVPSFIIHVRSAGFDAATRLNVWTIVDFKSIYKIRTQH